MSKTTLLDVKRIGSQPEPANITSTGTGESSFLSSTMATELSIGSFSKEPGRIYIEGRKFKNANQDQILNGVNTPWHYWNEFGRTSGQNMYDSTWWEEEFLRLKNRGVNSTRIWLNCDSSNEGITLAADGTCNEPTAKFWQDVDDLMALAEEHQIYVLPTIMSFDHFSWNTEGSERWHLMLYEESKVTSFINIFLIPFVERYKDNKYIFAIDLCNEMDWLSERSDYASLRNGTCTPAGGGSTTLTFNFRVPDYVVGQYIYVNSQYLGAVVSRVDDYTITTNTGYSGLSQTFNVGDWYFTGMNWSSIQRYAAMASSAIHRSESSILVCVGTGTIRYCSSVYDGDFWADSILSSITQDSQSKLDFHQIHWYSWAAPWYPLLESVTTNGLSEKPAIMGEMPAAWAELNIPSMNAWAPATWYQIGSFIWKDDNGTLRKYECTTSGNSGLDVGPSGTGTGITDGDAVWNYVTDTWKPNTAYAAWAMVINDSVGTSGVGRIYRVTYTGGGTSDVSGGPTGTGSDITDGTVTWEYVRDAITSSKTAMDELLEGGWVGHMPWASNNVDSNLGMYETGLGYPAPYPTSWIANTNYYTNDMALNDSDKYYRCITTGTSDSSGGPTGTGSDIIDGTVHWKYVKQLTYDDGGYWTPFGYDLKNFYIDNQSLIDINTSGSWDNSGISTRQSKERAWYKAGTDEQAVISVAFDLNAETDMYQRAGLFDSNDGLFLQLKGNPIEVSFVIRAATVDTEIPQSSWNVDKFNGTGPSSVTIDFNKVQFLVIEFGWMHGGKNRFGFFIDNKIWWAHEIRIGNSSTLILPTNPSLPISWQIGSPTAISAQRILSAYHGSVIATSNDIDIFKNRASNRVNSSIQIGGGNTVEGLSIRIPEAFRKYTMFRPKKLTVLNTSGMDHMFCWKLVLNPTVNGAGTWTNMDGSSLQYNITRSIQANTGSLISSGYHRGASYSIDLHNFSMITGEDILSFQIYNVPNAEHWIFISLDWDEIK